MHLNRYLQTWLSLKNLSLWKFSQIHKLKVTLERMEEKFNFPDNFILWLKLVLTAVHKLSLSSFTQSSIHSIMANFTKTDLTICKTKLQLVTETWLEWWLIRTTEFLLWQCSKFFEPVYVMFELFTDLKYGHMSWITSLTSALFCKNQLDMCNERNWTIMSRSEIPPLSKTAQI